MPASYPDPVLSQYRTTPSTDLPLEANLHQRLRDQMPWRSDAFQSAGGHFDHFDIVQRGQTDVSGSSRFQPARYRNGRAGLTAAFGALRQSDIGQTDLAFFRSPPDATTAPTPSLRPTGACRRIVPNRGYWSARPLWNLNCNFYFMTASLALWSGKRGV